MYAVRLLPSLLFIGCFDLDMGQEKVGCQTGWVTCIFPTKPKNNTNNKCTSKDSEVPWCATRVDEGDKNQVFEREWDECFDGCFELGNSSMAATTQEDTLGDTTNSSTMVPS
eukprot:GFUD01137365.1.p1 GENE.GFUD01137365.1~~GFUD01137365.1.p1  ORF type:complete len:112 (-),score=14.90 GFUD01137365.1:215-550(-)